MSLFLVFLFFKNQKTVTKKGCEIADPGDDTSSKIEEKSKVMCEGGTKEGEMTYPWFNLCCVWDEHKCKRKTGQTVKSKGTLLGTCSVFL